MTRHTHEGETVRPVDIALGDDGDMPGISQELTVDDIDDLAFDTSISVSDRREQLMLVLQETETRSTADRFNTSDMEGISSHLRDRIASLGNPLESQTVLESTGMDPDGRSDDDDPADHIDDEEPEEDGGP
ncbi:MAG: hypothetical protein B7Y90_13005 [Alphaproteobacteria bacterium 32-64-14]|nr:MAG: hypothetical protein B7Y90_13005 [Alphaproteobacteria bacterium 32-64-14]